ncbi:hypothetical protein [Polaribacter sp.]|uniref:hypothetical protein n=1 Tax=Polaribacter sp. TaxID=1920175 RepID=UPI003F6BC76F
METKYYSCLYCKKDFIPKRRKVQKFCSNSCRVSFHRFKNVDASIKSTEVQINNPKQQTRQTKIETISGAGIANATIGAGLAEIAKNILTREQNKPATKGDIAKLAAHLKRYHQIKNLPLNNLGQYPYFDLDTNRVVYFSIKFSI